MQKIVQFLVFAFVLSFSATADGQVTIFEEQFNDGTLGQFTAVSVIGDGQVWEAREFDDRMFAQINGFDGGIQDNEDWLISPALDMDASEDEVLTFANASNFDGPTLEVLVSNDYDGTSDPNTATWTDLSADVNWSDGDFTYEDSGELDLSSITGTGYIAFKYISNTAVQGRLWQVDSVVVSGTVTTNINFVEKELSLIADVAVQSDLLTFNVLADNKEVELVIYSMNGQQFDQFTIVNQTGLIQHTVSNLASGMYVLHARTEEGFQSVKFVKN